MKNQPFSITIGDDVSTICSPLQQILGVSYFEYAYVYPNGLRGVVSNRPDIVNHTYFQNKPLNQVYFPDYYPMGASYKVLSEAIKKRPVSIQKVYNHYIRDCYERFSTDNEIHFVNKYETHSEIFCYASHPGDTTFLPSFNEHFDLIKRFQIYFKNEARHLIKNALKYPAINPYRASNQIFQPDSLKNKFLNDTAINKLYLDDSKEHITKSELKCLRLMAKGISNVKFIANELNLSSRTIESHLSNIKNKLGCSYNHEIPLKLLTLQLNDYFIDN
jgi:DNA-binding CsgD family transcriptional regulator